MLRKMFALLAAFGLLVSPAAGFDTYWHSQCSQSVGEKFGFTPDAWKIMQLGTFSPDFFGPVSEYASKKIQGPELDALNQSGANDPQIRGAAMFLHFDNLNSDFKSNSNFDYLFAHFAAKHAESSCELQQAQCRRACPQGSDTHHPGCVAPRGDLRNRI
jgi:hypothetical protein